MTTLDMVPDTEETPPPEETQPEKVKSPAGTQTFKGVTLPRGLQLIIVKKPTGSDEDQMFYFSGKVYGVNMSFEVGSRDDLRALFGEGYDFEKISARYGATRMSQAAFEKEHVVMGGVDEITGATESLQSLVERDIQALGSSGIPEWIRGSKQALTLMAEGAREGWAPEKTWDDLAKTKAFKQRFGKVFGAVSEALGTDGTLSVVNEILAREQAIRDSIRYNRGPDAKATNKSVQKMMASGMTQTEIMEMLDDERSIREAIREYRGPDSPATFKAVHRLMGTGMSATEIETMLSEESQIREALHVYRGQETKASNRYIERLTGSGWTPTEIRSMLSEESQIREALVAYRGHEAKSSNKYIRGLTEAGWTANEITKMLSEEASIRESLRIYRGPETNVTNRYIASLTEAGFTPGEIRAMLSDEKAIRELIRTYRGPGSAASNRSIQKLLAAGETMGSIEEMLSDEKAIRESLRTYRGPDAAATLSYIHGLMESGWSAGEIDDMLAAEKRLKETPGALENMNAIRAYRGESPMSRGQLAQVMAGSAPPDVMESVNDALRMSALAEQGIKVSAAFAESLGDGTGAAQSGATLKGTARQAAQNIMRFQLELDAGKFGLTREDILSAAFDDEASAEVVEKLDKFARERASLGAGLAGPQGFVDAEGRLQVQGLAGL
ncbi:MAG: hypothetical protein ABIJ75_10815 [Actinomycetota bacterium]